MFDTPIFWECIPFEGRIKRDGGEDEGKKSAITAPGDKSVDEGPVRFPRHARLTSVPPDDP